MILVDTHCHLYSEEFADDIDANMGRKLVLSIAGK